MGLFDRFRSSGLDQPEAQPQAPRVQSPEFIARLAQEPEPQLGPGAQFWFNDELARARNEVDVDGMLKLYDAVPVGLRSWLMQEFEDEPFEVSDEIIAQRRALSRAWLEKLRSRNEPQATLFKAEMLMSLAWTHRGYTTLENVDQDDRDSYRDLNEAAFLAYLDAAEHMGSEDVTALIRAQVATANWSTQRIWEFASEWRKHDPWNRIGILLLIRFLDERWGGGPEAWLGFAAEIAEHAPAGSTALGLVPFAITERWEYLTSFEEMTFSDADQLVYQLPAVKQVLRLAYDRYLRSGAAPEIDEFVTYDLNNFMWACYWADLDDLAYDAMRRLGGNVRAEVWQGHRLNEPLGEFTYARNYLISEIEYGGREPV